MDVLPALPASPRRAIADLVFELSGIVDVSRVAMERVARLDEPERGRPHLWLDVNSPPEDLWWALVDVVRELLGDGAIHSHPVLRMIVSTG